MRWGLVRGFSSFQFKRQGPFQPTNIIDDRRETILLYRALLRQCTYLPDPAARKYMWKHVAERFHAYHPQKYKFPNGKIVYRAPKDITKERVLKQMKDARKDLKYLQRANDGHPQHLGKILDMTYGRVGKRRRELMHKLSAPSALTDNVAVALLSQKLFEAPTKRKVPELSDEALAILKSQIRQDSSRFDRAPLKDSQPKIPEVNSWNRPMPERRRVNMIKGWYAATLDRLMPPLEAEEWERIRKLATGETRWDGPVLQRKLGTTSPEREIQVEEEYIVPGDILCRLTSSTERVVEHKRHPQTRTNPHELTQRYMRGLWASVFKKCPKLDWNNESQSWKVIWGNVGKAGRLVMSPQKEIPKDVFEGVDDNGQVIKLSPMASS
ncbi:MAG: hypothetical protein Q9222_007327 [Ikaeria aurantiellina]